jgi:FtsP/CotA-like multicopper oxidase with cupredoxin domain
MRAGISYVHLMGIKISRRSFIAGSTFVFGAGRAGAQDAPFLKTHVLIAEPKTSKLFGEGPSTQHWHFRTSEDLPVIRARQGEQTTLRFINKLEEDIWLHFYGVRADSQTVTVLLPKEPEGTVDLAFTPPDAGTFWIGPLLNAGRQRGMGLYAMLIIEEANSAFEDIPIILDDWKVADDGILDRNFSDIAVAAGEGRLGNWVTVNGTSKPVLALSDTRPSRLRFLNVCNARTFNMQLRGVDALLIARDGQPIKPEPLPTAGLQLAPGQRADIVPTRSNDDMALHLDLGADTLEAAFFTTRGKLPGLPIGFALAANPWPIIDEGKASRTIPVTLEGGVRGGLKSARVGNETLELRALLEKGLAWAINGAAGLLPQHLFEAIQNETIILAFDNQTNFDQPIAIDGHIWRPLTTNGEQAEGQPWRDTAVIPAKTKASYVFVANNPGLWTLTSLIAERADAGLIGSFLVDEGP